MRRKGTHAMGMSFTTRVYVAVEKYELNINSELINFHAQFNIFKIQNNGAFVTSSLELIFFNRFVKRKNTFFFHALRQVITTFFSLAREFLISPSKSLESRTTRASNPGSRCLLIEMSKRASVWLLGDIIHRVVFTHFHCDGNSKDLYS